MSERTTEGATPDRAGIEGFFVRYGEAVSAGDLKAISGCYAVPAIVLSDAGSIPISTREEIEAAFDGAAERYRAQGMVAARPTIVAVENLSASESRIRDTDMAQEMMSFTRAQILSQAGTAMLAQANQLPQGVLQLLQ